MTAATTAIPDRAVDAVALAGSSTLHSLSPFGLFMNADMIGKLVILMLVCASVWCWAIIFDKLRTLKATKRRADKFEEAFWSGEPLDKLYERVRQSRPDPILKTFLSGMEEWRLGMADNKSSSDALGTNLQQRIERNMSVTIGREMEKLERSMTFLANVGSAAPFIGLFGTVWGIMRSFTAIAGSKNASLAVVAPGIAEALFATAIGLVAAIPAVIAYNKFSSDLNRYNDRLENFATEFSAILGRHLSARAK
jgi:biopolymer transport protein TolQ